LVLQRVGGDTGRATCEPDWKWSIHVGLGLGQTRCGLEHVGVKRSGTVAAAFDDGRDGATAGRRPLSHPAGAAR
jgi:hypothetical protein